MELKLVYRFLRKVSDWVVNGFYSEVYLEGQNNVPKEGPLIMYVHCSTFCDSSRSGPLCFSLKGVINALSWRVTNGIAVAEISLRHHTNSSPFSLTLRRLFTEYDILMPP